MEGFSPTENLSLIKSRSSSSPFKAVAKSKIYPSNKTLKLEETRTDEFGKLFSEKKFLECYSANVFSDQEKPFNVHN